MTAQAQPQADIPWMAAKRLATAICSLRVAPSARLAYFRPPAAPSLTAGPRRRASH